MKWWRDPHLVVGSGLFTSGAALVQIEGTEVRGIALALVVGGLVTLGAWIARQ